MPVSTTHLSGHVLIVTGPPGAGKTTAASAITSNATSPAVHLHADDFWHFIKSGFVQPFLPGSHAQNVVVLEALSNATRAYAAGGYLVVVDGIVGPWFLAPFRKLASPLHYIVLRPSLETTLTRVRSRNGAAPLASGTIALLHRQFSKLDGLEHNVIDTTTQSQAETQAAILAAAGGGRFRLD
jgi:chloramphenicol 3-O-phosphotransferase